MIRQAENRVKIEGILAEIDLRYGSFINRQGNQVESIGGTIKVLVDQVINGETKVLEIPVHMFATKFTRNGDINPSYESIEKVMKEFVSIAACGSKNQADRVRITNGSIKMNEFLGKNGQIVSYPRVTASFVSHAIGEFSPDAKFDLEFMLSSLTRVTDSDGVEIDPPRLKAEVIVPQFTPENATAMNVDVVTLYADSLNVINGVEEYWEPGKCYKISGRLNFTSKTEEVVEEVDFGEAQKTLRTTSVSEFIITGGSKNPLEGDFAFETDEIKAGLAARKERLNDIKTGKRNMNKRTPAQNTDKGKFDLGF